MRSVLLDTHAWVWSLTGDSRLSTNAAAHIARADSVLVSPVSFFEIGQKVRLGKWPEMEPFVLRLPELLVEQGGRVAALSCEIALNAAMLDWEHRDPFDRMLAATVIQDELALISIDSVFDGLKHAGTSILRLW